MLVGGNPQLTDAYRDIGSDGAAGDGFAALVYDFKRFNLEAANRFFVIQYAGISGDIRILERLKRRHALRRKVGSDVFFSIFHIYNLPRQP